MQLPLIIPDVRRDQEWNEAHIDGAVAVDDDFDRAARAGLPLVTSWPAAAAVR